MPQAAQTLPTQAIGHNHSNAGEATAAALISRDPAAPKGW